MSKICAFLNFCNHVLFPYDPQNVPTFAMNFSLDKYKNKQKFDSLYRATFARNLEVLLIDCS